MGAAPRQPPAHGLHHDEEEEVQVPRGAGAGRALLRAFRQRHPLLQGAAAGRGQLQRGVLPVGASGARQPSGCRGARCPAGSPGRAAATAAPFRRAPLESAAPQSRVLPRPESQGGRPPLQPPPPAPRLPPQGGWSSAGSRRAGVGGPREGAAAPGASGGSGPQPGASAGGQRRRLRACCSPLPSGRKAGTEVQSCVARFASGRAGCLLIPSALPSIDGYRTDVGALVDSSPAWLLAA